MNEFTLWYAYYDSLFLNMNPKLSQYFYEEYQCVKLDIISQKQNGLLIAVLTLQWHLNFFKLSSSSLQLGSTLSANENN
jgi:hypothetical protein